MQFTGKVKIFTSFLKQGFFKLRFTPYKAELPVQGMELQVPK